MSFPWVFFNLPAGPQSAQKLDDNFNALGRASVISATASGSLNAITLTPNAGFYSPVSYSFNQFVAFTSPLLSSGPVTAAFPGLAFVKVFMPSGVQANAGDIVLAGNYLMAFYPNLDAGAGGFLILNSQLPSVAQPTAGSFKNLKLTNIGAGAPNSQVVPTADELVLENVAGGAVRVRSFAPAVTNIAIVGANGLDAGAVAINTWYAWWAIFNPTTSTAAGLFSTSFTAPSLPAGYSYSARLGAFLTDGSSNLHRITQLGRRGQFVIQSSGPTIIPPVIVQGVQGTYSLTTPTLVTASVAGVVPPTASRVLYMAHSFYKAGATSAALVAPNINYGGTNNGPNGSNGMMYPTWFQANPSNGSYAEMLLEATTIAVASSGAGFGATVLGWEDNI